MATLTQLPARVRAQSTQDAIKARLKNQPLYLRGFWRDSDLRFDSSGHLKGHSDPVSFTLSGFEFASIAIKPNQLVLTGQRMVVEFRGNKVKRVPILTGAPSSPEYLEIKVAIDAPPNGDYTQALDAVFANGLAEIVPSLPFYWKGYAASNFLPAGPAGAPSAPMQASVSRPASKPLRIGPNNGITPPKLVHADEPKFSEVARALKYSGKVLINLWVTPDGKVIHLSIARPAGAGLDEQALAAVSQYTFSPAMQNGKPVLVELNIEVKFDIS